MCSEVIDIKSKHIVSEDIIGVDECVTDVSSIATKTLLVKEVQCTR